MMDAAARLLQAIGTGEICACGKSICDGREELQKHLDSYAHELAEKIRQEVSDAWDRGDQSWDVSDAADLIDPEVTY